MVEVVGGTEGNAPGHASRYWDRVSDKGSVEALCTCAGGCGSGAPLTPAHDVPAGRPGGLLRLCDPPPHRPRFDEPTPVVHRMENH